MKILLITLSLITLTSIGTMELEGTRHGGWTLEAEKDGIKIYTRPVIGSKLKQVRAVVSVDAPANTVLSVLTDYKDYHEWMNNVTESYVMDNPADSVHYVYRFEDAPWPVQNRYHVDKMVVEQEKDGTSVAFQSMPNYIDKTDEAIEVHRYEGAWRIKENGKNKCTVEYILDENPGGYVPSWLVNYLAIDAPYKTLSNLRSRVETLQRS